MRQLIAALIAAAIAFIAFTTPADGRLRDGCVEHSGDPYLDGFVGQALAEWGSQSGVQDCGAGDDITIRWVPELKGPAIGQATVIVDVRCYIDVDREQFERSNLTEEAMLYLVGHEVGHCLGLSHSMTPTAIMFHACCHPWIEEDYARMASRFPAEGGDVGGAGGQPSPEMTPTDAEPTGSAPRRTASPTMDTPVATSTPTPTLPPAAQPTYSDEPGRVYAQPGGGVTPIPAWRTEE